MQPTKSLPPSKSQTTVRVVEKRIDPAGLSAETANETNRPVVVLAAQSSLERPGVDVEFQVRINDGLWRPWTASGDLEVTGTELSVQGTHAVEVRSREAGRPVTQELQPARSRGPDRRQRSRNRIQATAERPCPR